MYSCRDVQFLARPLNLAPERQQVQIVGNRDLLNLPAELARHSDIIKQDLMDIDRFPQVSAFVPSQTLDGMRHGENIPGHSAASSAAQATRDGLKPGSWYPGRLAPGLRKAGAFLGREDPAWRDRHRSRGTAPPW